MKKPYWLIAIAAIILTLLATEFINVFVGLFLIGLLFVYVFFSEQAWLLVVLSPLALIFGQIIRIEIKPGWMYEISLTEIFLLIATGIFILDLLFKTKERHFYLRKTGWLLAIYTIFGLVSYFYIKDFELYIAGMKILTLSFLAYLMSLNFLTKPQRQRWFMVSLATTVIILTGQIFYTFYQTGFSSAIFLYRSYITIPIGAIALVAALLAFLLPILLSYYFQLDKKDILRPLFLIAFAIGALGVFLTLGKAAIASLLVGLIYLFFKFKKKRVAFVLFTALFILLAYLFFSQYSEGLITRLGNVFIDQNTQFRIDEYKIDYKIIKEHAVIGVGEGQQLAYYQKMINRDYRQWVNNYLVQVWIDLGLIGLLIYLSIIISLIFVLHNLNKTKRPLAYGLAAGFIVVWLNGLFEVTLFALPYAMIVWLMAGLANDLAIKPEKM